MKTHNWADRYLVMYCDFLLYYEPRNNMPPRDFDKPLGALSLDRVQVKKIKDFEERMDVSGLIPKTIFYEFCFEVPVVGNDGKERIVLLQFDRAETAKQWKLKLSAQAKNVEAMKTKIHPDLKNTIEVLMNKNPMSHRIKESPPNGHEEQWVMLLKGTTIRFSFPSSFPPIPHLHPHMTDHFSSSYTLLQKRSIIVLTNMLWNAVNAHLPLFCRIPNRPQQASQGSPPCSALLRFLPPQLQGLH